MIVYPILLILRDEQRMVEVGQEQSVGSLEASRSATCCTYVSMILEVLR